MSQLDDAITRWALRRSLVVRTFLCLAIILVTACTGYQKSGNGVVYKSWNEAWGSSSFIVKGADAASFQSLKGPYAKDKEHVYFRGSPIVGAEPSTFVALSETYAKDSEHAYFEAVVITHANPASFVASSDLNYAKDENDVYILGRPIEACDPQSFRWLKDDWQIDSKCAYRRAKKLPGADPRSFSVINYWYAKDNHQVYSSIRAVIEGADAGTFALANGSCEVCARDINRCYRDGKVVSCDSFK